MRLLKRIWAATWRITLFFLLWALLCAPLIILAAKRIAPIQGGTPLRLRLYIEIVSTVTILIAVWVMVRFVDQRPFVSLGFAPHKVMGDSIVGLIIGLGMMAVCVALLYLFGWATPEAIVSFSGSLLAAATIAMLANTFTQEVMIRGYVQQTIQSRFGPLSGIVVSALFFLVLHLGAIHSAVLPAVSLFAAGILLGTAYAVSGNLWLPIAVHFGWNFLQGPVLGQPVSGQSLDAGWRLFRLAGPPLMTGGNFGIEGGLIATAVTILGIPIVLLAYRRGKLSP